MAICDIEPRTQPPGERQQVHEEVEGTRGGARGLHAQRHRRGKGQQAEDVVVEESGLDEARAIPLLQLLQPLGVIVAHGGLHRGEQRLAARPAPPQIGVTQGSCVQGTWQGGPGDAPGTCQTQREEGCKHTSDAHLICQGATSGRAKD